MVTYFIGGAAGSVLGTVSIGAYGWAGVCVVGLALMAVALVVLAVGRRDD
jgi:predicted MFS family arabinose efflux permease